MGMEDEICGEPEIGGIGVIVVPYEYENAIPKTRVCCYCKKELPLNIDNFYPASSEKSGFCFVCIICSRKRTREYQLKNAERLRIIDKERRKLNKANNTNKNLDFKRKKRACYKCKRTFLLNSRFFYIDRHFRDGFKRICKECASKEFKKWREKNKNKSSLPA